MNLQLENNPKRTMPKSMFSNIQMLGFEERESIKILKSNKSERRERKRERWRPGEKMPS